MSAVKQAQETIAAGTWKLDPVHSTLSFAVEHSGLSKFRGQVPGIEGTLEISDGRGVVSGVGRPETLSTQDENLDGHLQSPDFFDTERHPVASFRSEQFDAVAGDYELQAELELRGVVHTVPVQVTVKQPRAYLDQAERLGVALSTTIDRRDYGIDWQMELPGGGDALGHDVELVAELELVHEE